MGGFNLKHQIRKPWLQRSWAEVKIHLAVTLVVGSTLLFAEPRETLIAGGLLCLITYAYLGVSEARKATLWLSPLSFYFFWYCIGLGVSPIYVGLTTEQGDLIRFASENSQVSLQDLAVGYVLFLVGSFALHLGMQIFRPQSQADARDSYSPRLLPWLAAIWVGGLLFQLNPISFSFLGATTKILAVALVGSVCGFAIIPHKKLGLSRAAFLVLLSIGTAGLFFGNLASGSKAYIMFSFLPIIWAFILRRGLRVWIPILALALGLFYLAVVAPVVHTARQRPLEEGQDPRMHVIEAFETWGKERPEQLNQSFLAEQSDQFLNRQFDAVPVGFIVGEVKASGLLLGETMKYASYAFIPRLLWPDKPTVTRGAWFSMYLGLFQTEAEATTAFGMTAVGELYWNFGVMGVLVGMLAIGCGQGLLWRMAGADPRSRPLHMLLYVSIMLTMPDMAEAVTPFASLAVSFLTFKAAFTAIAMLKHRREIEEVSPLRTEFLHR